MKNEPKKFCPNCGSELSDDAKFCGKCGYQFNTIPISQTQIPIKKEKKKHTALKVIGILIVAFFIFAIFSEDETNDSDTSISYEESKNTEYEYYETNDTFDLSTPLDLYTFLQDIGDTTYLLNSKSEQFLSNYDYLFPASNISDIPSDTVDSTIDYRQILKNDQKFGDKLIILKPLQVQQIFEEEIGDEQYLTQLNVMDENGQQYWIYYNGELSDIYENDFINVIGLPLGNSSFENTTGGETLVIVLAGSYIELAQ